MDDIYAGRLGSFDIVTTMKKAKPRVIRPFWRPGEFEVFDNIRASYRYNKIDVPQMFTNAIQNKDVLSVITEVQSFLDRSDLVVSRHLRRRCKKLIELRSRLL